MPKSGNDFGLLSEGELGLPNTIDSWEVFVSLVSKLYSDLGASRTVEVSSEQEKVATKQLVRYFFRNIRSSLIECEIEISEIDQYLQTLLELANKRGHRKVYLENLRSIKKLIPSIEIQRERWMSVHKTVAGRMQVVFTQTENNLQKILNKLDSGLGDSYKQALLDLSDVNRISYGGTANELREVVRRVLDKLAPDDDVEKADWFTLESGTHKPTMKQKTRFILVSRGLAKSQRELAEKGVNLIDIEIDAIGGITRSTYDSGSSMSHARAAKEHALRLKRYVDAVLCDILEVE